MDYNEVCRMVQEALPGVTTGRLQIADGEGVATSYSESGSWHVSYVRFVENEDEESGFEVEVSTLDEEFEDPHEAAWEAGALAEHLPRPAFLKAAEPPDGAVERRLWQKTKLQMLKRRARKEIIEELVQEARSLVLLQGLSQYAPQPEGMKNMYPARESDLWPVLKVLSEQSSEEEEPGE